MCIFSSDTVVSTTKIFTGVLSPTRRLLGYSNNVTVGKGGTVMMLPIPTSGEVIFHDSTPYNDFLLKISEQVARNAMRGSRGTMTLGKSLFQSVGMYKMKMVQSFEVVDTLVELEQPVQKWLPKMLDTYTGYQWLFVIIPEGREISAQPLLIEFEQTIRPTDLYFPMMDVHGDEEIQKHVSRDHILIVGDATFQVNDDNFKIDLPNFPWNGNFVFGGVKLKGRYSNGDAWGVFKGCNETVNDYQLTFDTPYPLPS